MSAARPVRATAAATMTDIVNITVFHDEQKL